MTNQDVKKIKICIDYQKKRIDYRRSINKLNEIDKHILSLLKIYQKLIDTTKNKILNIPFEEIWNIYDKKVDKQDAILQWGKLTDKERMKSIEHAPLYVQATPDKSKRLHLHRYLRKKSFNNEIITNIQTKLQPQEQINHEKIWLTGNE